MQIKRLEEIVGDTLFERGPRGVWLTGKGSELLGNARRIVSLLDETAAQIGAPPLDGPVQHRHSRGIRLFDPVAGARARSPNASPEVEITARYACSSEQMAALGPTNSISPSSSNGRIFRTATC